MLAAERIYPGDLERAVNVAHGSIAAEPFSPSTHLCPLLVGGLNGSTQHFIFEGKDGV